MTQKQTPRGEQEENTHFLKDLGFCNHKWSYIRTEESNYIVMDICVCIKCGKRKGFKVF